jgi:UDPglucose 6-dehydrogenase
MDIKIGIIGLGIIGSATKQGFEHLGHEISVHDIKLNTNINDVLKTDICFICVPTPSTPEGKCDTSIVDSVVGELIINNYKGLMAIKSTVVPGLVDSLSLKYNTKNIAFVPEFLRERCATEDFIYNQDLCVIGTYTDKDYNLIKRVHGNLPKSFSKCSPIEAEFVKYFNNIYNASLITFANSFAVVCEHMDVDYNRVKEIAVQRNHIQDTYLNSSSDVRGFGGMCLPKDTKAFNQLAKEVSNTKVTFFEDILKQNNKFPTTVFKGMRK